MNFEINPATCDATAKQNGLTVLDRVRVLRADFGLSMAEAKAVVDATDGKPPLFPRVNDGKELTTALASELGYCGCASPAAAEVLRQFLRVVRRRTDAGGDAAEFALASRELESLLAGGGGWAEWLVYVLDQKDFVQHGFRQTDVLISEKGRLLLAAVEQFEPE